MLKRFIDKEEKLSFDEKKVELKEIIDIIARKFLLYIAYEDPDVLMNKLIPNIVNQIKTQSNYDPRYIIFTGQYLGSYVKTSLEMLGNRNRITSFISNDIDIFVPLYNLTSAKNDNDIHVDDEIPFVDNYSSIDFISRYKIVSSTYATIAIHRNIPVNITLVEHDILSRYTKNKENNLKKLIHLAEEIIDKFDINSVKIGVVFDVKEMKVVKTIIHEDYINFLLSGYLQLSNTTNFFKSFPRVIKKVVEFMKNSTFVSKDIAPNELIEYFETGKIAIKNKNKSGKYVVDSNRFLISFPKEIKYLELHSKITLNKIGVVKGSETVSYPNYKEIYKYFEYLQAIYMKFKYGIIRDSKTLDEIGYLVDNPLEIKLSDNKKLSKLYELGFGAFLEQGGFTVNIDKQKSKGISLTFKIVIHKDDLDYEKIIDDSLIIREYLDDYFSKLSERTRSYPPTASDMQYIAKIQLLYDKLSKKKITRIYEYLNSILREKSFMLLAISEIIKHNQTNIPLGELKIMKKIEEHVEIHDYLIRLLKLYDFRRALKIISLIDNLIHELLDELVDDKKAKQLIYLELLRPVFASSNVTNVDLHIGLLESKNDEEDKEVLKEHLSQFIKNKIKEQLNLKNDVVLPEEFKKIMVVVGDYVIEELKTSFDLRYEGSVMNHCVGGYANNVKNYRSSIFKLYSDNDKKFRYTCEINPLTYDVIQIRGKSNKPVSSEHKEIVDELIEKVIEHMKEQDRSTIVQDSMEQKTVLYTPPPAPNVVDLGIDIDDAVRAEPF